MISTQQEAVRFKELVKKLEDDLSRSSGAAGIGLIFEVWRDLGRPVRVGDDESLLGIQI